MLIRFRVDLKEIEAFFLDLCAKYENNDNFELVDVSIASWSRYDCIASSSRWKHGTNNKSNFTIETWGYWRIMAPLCAHIAT